MASETEPTRISKIKANFQNPEYKNKLICTLFLFWAFIYLGMCAGLGGPSFMDLMLITKTELDQASTLFTAGAVGYMVGALISGALYDMCNKLLLLAVAIIGTAISTAVKPICTSLPVMVGMSFLGAVFAAGIDTGGNADLVRLWGGKGKAFMQTLHFCFALGGLMAPLITEPFLAPRLLNADNTTFIPDFVTVTGSYINSTVTWYGDMDSGNETMTSSGFNSSETMATAIFNTSETMSRVDPQESRILYAYLIVGGVGITATIPFFVEFFLRKMDKNRKPESNDSKREHKIPLPIYIVTIALIGLFFFNYCALEETFVSFLTVFTVEGLKWTKVDGALVTSVFWGSFAACRFLGIFFIHFLSPKRMLILCLTLLLVSLCAFLICSLFAATLGIWVSSVGVGFSTSIIFPTAFTWIEEHLIKVTGKVTSVIMVSASSAGTATPLFLGYLMENVTYMSFSYLLFAQSVFLIILYVIMNALSTHMLSKYKWPIEQETSKTDPGNETNTAML